MNLRYARFSVALVGCVLLATAGSIRADLIACTSLEEAEGYTPPGGDVRNYDNNAPSLPLPEPGDWGGNYFDGTKGGPEYTGVLAEGPGSAYAGSQFFFMQRSGTDGTNTDLVIRRKFPVQTALLYYRWAFRIDSQATQAPYWGVSGTINNINFAVDRKIDTLDNTNNDASYISHIGTETMRIELHEDGRIMVKQSSFGGDITLTKRWNGTTTDGSEPVTSALNNWVKVEVLLDVPGQRWWFLWDGTYLGSYPFRRNLTNSGGIRQVNMIRFQSPRLDYVGRGERLRIDDIELRTDPPAALPTCLTLVSPGDIAATANAGQPATPSTIEYVVNNFGSGEVTWTAEELDANQNPADVSWLSLSSTGGTLDSMDSTTVIAGIDTTDVPGGDHYAYVKFTDNCDSQNVAVRQIKLTIVGCTWTVSSCNQVRGVLEKYPSATVAPVSFVVSNTGQTPLDYTVTPSGSFEWLNLTDATSTLAAGSAATVVGEVDKTWFASQGTPGNSYTCTLTFTDNCSGQVVTRQVRVRYVAEADTQFAEYVGNVDPLQDDSAGPGLRLDLYNEEGLTVDGQVEADPQADNGWTFRIQDTAYEKTKYRFVTNDGDRVMVYNEAGITIVGRVRVHSWAVTREGGLFIWDKDAASAKCHWGGWTNPILAEVHRGWSTAVVPPEPLRNEYVILRMTAVGRPNSTGLTDWNCSRSVRIYLNENPVPVVPADLGAIAGAATELNYGFGFGAGSTGGSYDIAFDWVTATNAGAFAPGEEEAVLGRSLVLDFCPKPFADSDRDGDVDQHDFAVFQQCYTGNGDSAGLFDALRCGCLDRDRDDDVDGDDYAAFEGCATGPGVPFDLQDPPAACTP